MKNNSVTIYDGRQWVDADEIKNDMDYSFNKILENYENIIEAYEEEIFSLKEENNKLEELNDELVEKNEELKLAVEVLGDENNELLEEIEVLTYSMKRNDN